MVCFHLGILVFSIICKMKISSAEVPSVEESISTKENGSSYENSDTSVVCNLKVSNVFGNAICNTTNAIDKILADLETNSPLTNGVSGENSSISNGNKSDDSFSCSPANTQRTDDNFSDVSEESIKLHLTDDEEDQDKFDEKDVPPTDNIACTLAGAYHSSDALPPLSSHEPSSDETQTPAADETDSSNTAMVAIAPIQNIHLAMSFLDTDSSVYAKTKKSAPEPNDTEKGDITINQRSSLSDCSNGEIFLDARSDVEEADGVSAPIKTAKKVLGSDETTPVAECSNSDVPSAIKTISTSEKGDNNVDDFQSDDNNMIESASEKRNTPCGELSNTEREDWETSVDSDKTLDEGNLKETETVINAIDTILQEGTAVKSEGVPRKYSAKPSKSKYQRKTKKRKKCFLSQRKRYSKYPASLIDTWWEISRAEKSSTKGTTNGPAKEDSDDVPLILRKAKLNELDARQNQLEVSKDDDVTVKSHSDGELGPKNRNINRRFSYREISDSEGTSSPSSSADSNEKLKSKAVDELEMSTIDETCSGNMEVDPVSDPSPLENPGEIRYNVHCEMEVDTLTAAVPFDDIQGTNDDEKLSEIAETKVNAKDDNGGDSNETPKKQEVETDKKEEIIIDNTSTKKRSLDEKEDAVELKKQKINDGEDEQTEPKKYNIPLDHFRTFMDSKMHSLTRKELEEYCIQKVCEVVGQTSEIGELRHQIKQQEQMLELWRSKMISLNKQTKDLEVVNCKLIQDVRAREREGANVADAVPVKITRSVGLQVSLTLNSLVPRARASTSSVTPPAPSESPQLKRKTRTLLPNSPASTVPLGPVTPPTRSPATPSRPAGTIKTILPRKTPEPKDAQQASLLSKVLQKPPLVPNTPVPIAIRKPSTAEPPKAGVIDLTDEDDIARTVSTPTQVTTGIRVVTPQQISSTAQVVTAGASLVTTTGPRLSYIVTPSGQQPQQVLLATSTAPTRPGQLQRTYMLKPLQNAVATQRVGSIRLPGSPVTVVTQPTRPGQQIRLGGVSTMTTRPIVQRTTTVQIRHPAPLPGPPPLQPSQPSWKAMPPRPSLKISRVGDGIVLSWKILTKELSHYEEIASYQLYAYQETNAAPATDMWRKVGDVKALALPMACTLTQFTDGNKYHFAVRAVDVKSRVGPFSQPEQIVLS